MVAHHAADPVVDDLGPGAARVRLPRQRYAEPHPQPGLLLDLADRRGDGRLAPVELALGEGPVVVRRAVHQQDPALAQDHGTGGADVSGPGRGRHAASLTSPSRGGHRRGHHPGTKEHACGDDSGSPARSWWRSRSRSAGCLWWRGGDDRTSFAWAVEPRAGRHPARLVDGLGRGPGPREGATCRPAPRPRDLRRFLAAAFDDDLSSTSALVGIGAGAPGALRLLTRDRRLGALQPVRPGGRGDAAPAAGPTSTPWRTICARSATRSPSDADGRLGGRARPGGPDLARPDPRAVLRRGRPDDSLVLTSDSVGVPVGGPAGGARRRRPGDGARRRGRRRRRAAVGGGLHRRLRLRRLAMAHAGAADQAEGRRLLAAAGEVNPYSAVRDVG